ncbi:MAG TPA: sugar transferase [Blastocatellia bacterium]|nr:sugar transferase [Blastocatellia bacterium]
MVRRLRDIILAITALIILSPLLIAAAVGIKLCSKGPVLFCAQRVGRNNHLFTMYKFRTMHVQQNRQSVITAHHDPRVFSFGALLRKSKIDELPQLFNIIKGEMSFVGPRPEDPEIVAKFYSPTHYETLNVLPGLASPGSIYNYTHGEKFLDQCDPEKVYVERLLPVKLALDLVYVRELSTLYDIQIMWRTLMAITKIALGQREFPPPPEMNRARFPA